MLSYHFWGYRFIIEWRRSAIILNSLKRVVSDWVSSDERIRGDSKKLYSQPNSNFFPQPSPILIFWRHHFCERILQRILLWTKVLPLSRKDDSNSMEALSKDHETSWLNQKWLWNTIIYHFLLEISYQFVMKLTPSKISKETANLWISRDHGMNQSSPDHRSLQQHLNWCPPLAPQKTIWTSRTSFHWSLRSASIRLPNHRLVV